MPNLCVCVLNLRVNCIESNTETMYKTANVVYCFMLTVLSECCCTTAVLLLSNLHDCRSLTVVYLYTVVLVMLIHALLRLILDGVKSTE